MRIDDKALALYVGNKIKTLRKDAKLTQTDLGSVLNVKNNTISAYERGVVTPNLDDLKTLADYFNTKVDDFFPKDSLVLNQITEEHNLNGSDLELLHTIIDQAMKIDEDKRDEFLEKLLFVVQLYK